jgi:hypothetical protein
MRIFECPKCHDESEEPVATAMAHHCPSNKSKWTEWVLKEENAKHTGKPGGQPHR